MTTPRTRLTALAGAVLVTVITAGCTQSTPDPGITPLTTSNSPAATGSSTSAPATSSTTPATASTTPTAEEQASADAKTAYDAYTASFKQAAATFDPSKLDRTAATTELVKATTAELRRLAPGEGESLSLRWTQSIKDMRPSRYVKGKEVQLQICAVLDGRFFKNGKDVTVDRDGNPVPPNKDAKSNQIQFVSTDGGKTWKMNSFVYSPEIGSSC